MRRFQLVAISILSTFLFSLAYSQMNQTISSPVLEINSICGDRICLEDENCEDCPLDCKCLSNETCFNGTCIPRSGCGNRICESSENCKDCPDDCRCPTGFFCLGGICTSRTQATGFAVLIPQVRGETIIWILSLLVLLLVFFIKRKMYELGIK